MDGAFDGTGGRQHAAAPASRSPRRAGMPFVAAPAEVVRLRSLVRHQAGELRKLRAEAARAREADASTAGDLRALEERMQALELGRTAAAGGTGGGSPSGASLHAAAAGDPVLGSSAPPSPGVGGPAPGRSDPSPATQTRLVPLEALERAAEGWQGHAIGGYQSGWLAVAFAGDRTARQGAAQAGADEVRLGLSRLDAWVQGTAASLPGASRTSAGFAQALRAPAMAGCVQTGLAAVAAVARDASTRWDALFCLLVGGGDHCFPGEGEGRGKGKSARVQTGDGGVDSEEGRRAVSLCVLRRGSAKGWLPLHKTRIH